MESDPKEVSDDSDSSDDEYRKFRGTEDVPFGAKVPPHDTGIGG